MDTWLGHVGVVEELPLLRVVKGTRDPVAFPQIEQFSPIATRHGETKGQTVLVIAPSLASVPGQGQCGVAPSTLP